MFSISPLQWFTVAACLYGGSLFFFLLKREKVSLILLLSGFAVNTAYQLYRGWHYVIPTSDNMVTEIYFIPWCLAFLALGLRLRKKYSGAALSIVLPICFFTAIALIFPTVVVPPDPKHNVFLSTLFFWIESMAHACFFVAGWFGLLFLLKRTEDPFFDSFAVWGFVLYSIAQIAGAVWCYLGWAAPFNWSEKHLLSAALWCFYCAYLHLNFSTRWNVREKSWFAFTGLWVTFAIAYNYYIHYLGGKGA
jgi:hypothetical protein